jgi:3'(2'), 5'-bisphosphate nucleotidase
MREAAEKARDLVREAGALVRAMQEGIRPRDKGAGKGPVTEADLASEHLLLEGIERAFPGDGIVSEETRFGPPPAARRVWCVDPLDGTREYSDGLAEYAVMAGLLEDGEPVVGAFALPALDVVLWGWRGGGAFADDVPIRLAPMTDPSAATAIHSRSHRSAKLAEVLDRIRPRERISAGGVGYKVGQILLGRAHLYVHPQKGTLWWDSVAPAAVLLAAGGSVGTATGDPLEYRGNLDHGEGLLFTVPRLLEAVKTRLA